MKIRNEQSPITEEVREKEELEAELGETETGWEKFKTMCRENKLAVASAVVILIITLAAIFAPLVAPYESVRNRISPTGCRV